MIVTSSVCSSAGSRVRSPRPWLGPWLGRSLGRSLLVTSLLALGAASSLGCTHHVAASTSPAAQSITVVGRAEVQAKPDLARVTLGVESRTPTVAEGSRLTNEQIARVIAAVRAVGVAEADVRTSNYSIYFERFPTHDGYPAPSAVPYAAPAPESAVAPAAPAGRASKAPAAPPAPAPAAASGPAPSMAPAASVAMAAPSPGGRAPEGAYRVANTVEITIRDISKVATVLDAAVATGANEVHGVSFDIDRHDAYDAQVREKAVADARERAAALAKLHGKTLGAVISVSEVVTDVGRPMFAALPMMSRLEGAQISAGEMTIGGQLQVTYAFEE